MKICPITYEKISKDEVYSSRGLHLLSPSLKNLKKFPLSALEQRRQAVAYAHKLSIQGVQPKLSAKLNAKEEVFEVTQSQGRFILKPQSDLYPSLPENEDLTMRLASLVGFEVPLHGLMWCSDDTLTYFIHRFDRTGKGEKLAVEDFAQLTGNTRDTKYESSMEKVAEVIDSFCTFPVLEKIKLLQRAVFSFVVGNEDMHLKNFSVISRDDKVELSPCYDLVGTTLVLSGKPEEMALPLHGKKHKLKRDDFRAYFTEQKLKLPVHTFDRFVESLSKKIPEMNDLIERSFLSVEFKEKYQSLLVARLKTLAA